MLDTPTILRATRSTYGEIRGKMRREHRTSGARGQCGFGTTPSPLWRSFQALSERSVCQCAGRLGTLEPARVVESCIGLYILSSIRGPGEPDRLKSVPVHVVFGYAGVDYLLPSFIDGNLG
ncbi:hypothetical protein C8Q77DRAFT_476577 [Trametes polyzona]|nr:hypothetical protein C8Q77DRAFT_476577 [Trametes polyzona]